MNGVLALLAILLLAVRPVAAAEPDRAAIAAHVAASLPQTLALRADWRSRTFADPGGHSGRISVEGTLVLTEPLYGVNPSGPTFGLHPRDVRRGLHRLVADTAARGVPSAQVLRIGEATKWIRWATTVMEETVPGGTQVPFRAEIRYLETVSGFDLSGRPTWTAPKGFLRAQLGNELIRGSRNYQITIDLIVDFWEGEQRTLQDNAEEMEAFLASDGLTAFFPLQRNAAPAPILTIPPTVAAWYEDDYRAYNGAQIRRLTFHTRVAAVIASAVRFGQSDFAPGQAIEIDLKGSVIGDAEPLKTARLTIELPGATPPGLSGEMRWTGTGFAVTPTAPDSGWQVGLRSPAPAETPAAEAPATQPPAETPAETPAEPATLASLDGRWSTPDGKLRVEISDGVGTILSGGSGARPDGIDLLRLDAFDGTAATGRMRFRGGNFQPVTVRLNGDRLDFRSGGLAWHWVRTGG
jgi:hypothetical protein